MIYVLTYMISCDVYTSIYYLKNSTAKPQLNDFWAAFVEERK